ncbi:metallophosphoesterase family protein [Shinella zoogloeoides]|uniref:Metallophosphoesterase n=1 Tax=Shinella zoogloeoides TaxID=352475 RepID=A0A6N8T932_SHIZO|nr:metallophosphoesterase family protein [Shinella zoogloeoides]MXN98675.1 metallophosphoesterase [Shinella zoogloeoides]UEX83128.1 metallophosphoesterase family protein [Shinella zoogloeoides]
MLLAVLSDIHANREAFEAVLAAAESAGAERLMLLGDIVGYGADPEWCAERAMALAEAGAIVLRGNHDDAVGNPSVSMNPTATIALEWTRRQLGGRTRAFLAALPFKAREGDCLFVHADASAPADWNYVLDTGDAEQHLAACTTPVSFCGHVHKPALYCTAPGGKVTHFCPVAATPVPLLPQRRWLAVMGAVGQPRDGNPAAAFALYDTASATLRFLRVAYDVEKAADKIRAAGLPASLADRLFRGR